jgi:hypothetical protein
MTHTYTRRARRILRLPSLLQRHKTDQRTFPVGHRAQKFRAPLCPHAGVRYGHAPSTRTRTGARAHTHAPAHTRSNTHTQVTPSPENTVRWKSPLLEKPVDKKQLAAEEEQGVSHTHCHGCCHGHCCGHGHDTPLALRSPFAHTDMDTDTQAPCHTHRHFNMIHTYTQPHTTARVCRTIRRKA